MSAPTTADIRKALARREREWTRDLVEAQRTWGAADPGTQLRARKLSGCLRAMAEGRQMTRAEFAGDVA